MTKSKQKKFQPGNGYTEADWNAVLDTPEATDKQIAKAKPFAEAFPDMAASAKRTRGRPPVEAPKESVTLRVDADILEAYRATGKGWQTRMNDWLRLGISASRPPTEFGKAVLLHEIADFEDRMLHPHRVIIETTRHGKMIEPHPVGPRPKNDPVPARPRRSPTS